MLAGFNDQTWTGPNLPLPQSLATLGMQGCPLYIDPQITSGLPTGPHAFGLQTQTITVPNIPFLVGTQAYFQ